MIITPAPGPAGINCGTAAFVGAAEQPQWLNSARAIGFGLVFAAVGLSTSTPAGAEYHFGNHQKAIYESQFKGIIFHPPHPNIPGDAVRFLQGAPQAYDFTLQGSITQASILLNQSIAISSEYQFGTHATQLANSQIASQIFAPSRTPPQVGGQVPLRSIHVNPQELTRDLTLQPSIPFVPVATGWILTYVGAGPQLVDLTLQASFQQAPIYNINANWSPTTIISVMQADPWQRQAQVYKPSARSIPGQLQKTLIAAPTPWDPTQNQGRIIASLSPPPSHAVQPVIILIGEQKYDNLYPLVLTQPLIYVAPPPFTGFWVQAVSAGWYGGRFRTPGDIFLLAQAADFSDSSVNYQPPSSDTVGYGWMTRTAATAAYDWLQSNGSPYPTTAGPPAPLYLLGDAWHLIPDLD